MDAAWRGFALGFVIAVTPGPMFFLCLTRTVASGWRAGLATGLGIATADGFYAAVAAGAVGVVGALLTGSQRWLTLGGGLALCLLGARGLILSPARRGTGSLLPARRGGGREAAGGAHAYASALALTLANPATIVSFAALFAALGVRSPVTVVAVALGSLTWWLVVVAGASRLRAALGERTRLLRWLSGLALVAFGTVAVLSALHR
jgi:threonine/homoserine/homoserine lactone efflux protein